MKRILTFLTVLLAALSAFSAEYYVDASRPDDTGAAASWATAKQTIQAAVDLTSDGDTVWVTNGVYDLGGASAPSIPAGVYFEPMDVMSRVCITNAITVKSVNGSGVTIIKGFPGSNGSNDVDSVRGAYLSHGGSLVGLTVSNGYTVADGGGVWLTGDCVVSNCILTGNSASLGGGASLYLGGTLENSIIEGNTVCEGAIVELYLEAQGGGIFMGGGSDQSLIKNCVIRGNVAPSGGGISAFYEGSVDQCTIVSNIASGNAGGIFHMGHDVRNSIVSHNEAGGNGGGLELVFGANLENCEVSHNTAVGNGGGLYCRESNEKVSSCLVTYNIAQLSGGGVYCSERAGPVNNCTVARNSAGSGEGGGIYLTAGCELNNSVIYRNLSSTTGNLYRDGATVRNTFAYDGVTNGVDGCIKSASSPFVNSLTDFRLMIGVPCINAGSNTYAPLGTDLAGNPRIIDGIVDMGAYEFFIGTNDFDGDGLPNDWESDYFGNITNANKEVTCSNAINTVWEAYIAGLDPSDPDSQFLTSVFRSPTSTVLGWDATSGRVYSVHWSTNLLDGFQPLETNIPWSAGGFIDTNHPTDDKVFYKIDVQIDE